MKIYQTRDFHGSFDYEDEKVALNEYELVYETDKYEQSNDEEYAPVDLEDIFQYFNCWEDKDGKIEQTFRSLSVGDIVELNGKFYRCESIGWKEMNIKEKVALVEKAE
jgi:hypothetical protein